MNPRSLCPRRRTAAPGVGRARRRSLRRPSRDPAQQVRPARSFMFVGLRGVGKTVLLNEVQTMAEEEGALTDFIEVANNEPL